MIRQGPLGYFPMLAWLLHRRCPARCCLRPRGVGRHSSLSHLPFCLRLLSRDRHFPNNSYSRGYVSDSGHTPFTSLNLHITPNERQYTTGRLTKPYPGGPVLSHSPLNDEPEPGSNDNISLIAGNQRPAERSDVYTGPVHALLGSILATISVLLLMRIAPGDCLRFHRNRIHDIENGL